MCLCWRPRWVWLRRTGSRCPRFLLRTAAHGIRKTVSGSSVSSARLSCAGVQGARIQGTNLPGTRGRTRLAPANTAHRSASSSGAQGRRTRLAAPETFDEHLVPDGFEAVDAESAGCDGYTQAKPARTDISAKNGSDIDIGAERCVPITGRRRSEPASGDDLFILSVRLMGLHSAGRCFESKSVSRPIAVNIPDRNRFSCLPRYESARGQLCTGADNWRRSIFSANSVRFDGGYRFRHARAIEEWRNTIDDAAVFSINGIRKPLSGHNSNHYAGYSSDNAANDPGVDKRAHVRGQHCTTTGSAFRDTDSTNIGPNLHDCPTSSVGSASVRIAELSAGDHCNR